MAIKGDVMREIKFRFIFKDGNFIAKRFKTLDEICDSSFIIEVMEEDISANSGSCDIEDFPEYKIFKDEYIGLKDKNGVEIFESDIAIDKHDYIYLIDFRKGGFVAVHAPDCRAEAEGECKWDDLGSIYDELEVIGNIHENPELLDNANG